MQKAMIRASGDMSRPPLQSERMSRIDASEFRFKELGPPEGRFLGKKGKSAMMTLGKLKGHRKIIDSIDWSMTPEEAVTLYLEWGNNWSHGRMVKSKKDMSYYFVVNTWEGSPKIYLIRRNSDEAVELACFNPPMNLGKDFMEGASHRKGVYALTRELKEWLRGELETQVNDISPHVAHRRTRGHESDSSSDHT